MLRLIVFLCGASLMSLEMVAARVLAPSMGNSIYVWGSVISSVMVALSLGYWLGGHAADRWGASRVLPVVIAGASLSTVIAPSVASVVVPWAADLGPRAGSLVAAALVFFVPSLLMATVSPLGVRLAAVRMEHIGRSAGGLYAVSTAGSIVGTIATAFWLIPLLSIGPLIVWTGFLLGAVALLALGLSARTALLAPEAERYAPRELPARAVVSVALALVLAGVAVGGVALAGTGSAVTNELGETVLMRADTQYHRVTVTEDDEARHLRFDRSHQSAIYLDDEYESAIRYPDYLHLALAVRPEPERVLVLGLGGGTVVKRMWRDYPDVRIDAVEIDPVVVDVAERYFGLPEDERVRVFVEDARRYVQRCEETYDIVMIDAYYADGLPFHLTTREFFDEVDGVLAPGGVVAYNVISSVEGERSELFRSMYRTAQESWDRLWVFPIGLGGDGNLLTNRNIIVLATDAEVSRGELVDRIADRVGGSVSIEGFAGMRDDLYTGVIEMADVPLLTDDHAPTDSLIRVD